MKQIDFGNGSIGKCVMQSAGPMLVAQVLNLMYSIVDRIYIGKIQNTGMIALGGIGLCFPVIIIITAFTNLYGTGGAPLCAMARGKGDDQRAEKIMNTAFRLLLVTALIITVLGEIFCCPLLFLFGASEVTIGYAVPYMRIYLIGTAASMISAGLNPFITAQGYSFAGMLTVFIGTIANIILDPVFIFVFRMGVSGAAIATVISQCISAFFVLLFLVRSKAELKLHKKMQWDGSLALDIISLGTAGFVMQCTNSLVSIVCNHVLSIYGGDIYVSAMTIITSVRQILDTPVMAVGEGTSPVLSYNYGAGKFKRVCSAIRLNTIIGVGYTAAAWILIILFPAGFIGIFNNDQSLLKIAVPALHAYFFAFVFQALQYSGQTVFKSLNKKRRAIFFSLFRKVIMVIPLTILLPRFAGLGAQGVFIAEPVSNFIGGSACFITMLVTLIPELKDAKH